MRIVLLPVCYALWIQRQHLLSAACKGSEYWDVNDSNTIRPYSNLTEQETYLPETIKQQFVCLLKYEETRVATWLFLDINPLIPGHHHYYFAIEYAHQSSNNLFPI